MQARSLPAVGHGASGKGTGKPEMLNLSLFLLVFFFKGVHNDFIIKVKTKALR